MHDDIREYIEAAAASSATKARKEIEAVVERLESKIDHNLKALALLAAKMDRRSDAIEDGVRELTARDASLSVALHR